MDEIKADKDRDDDTTEYEVELKFNGHEIDINGFLDLFKYNYESQVAIKAEKTAYSKAEKMYEEKINRFTSKQSPNVKLESIKKQFDKLVVGMTNIEMNLVDVINQIDPVAEAWNLLIENCKKSKGCVQCSLKDKCNFINDVFPSDWERI